LISLHGWASEDGLEKWRSLIIQWMDGIAFVASVMAWEFMNEKHNFKPHISSEREMR
jgi:hypothetical protein